MSVLASAKAYLLGGSSPLAALLPGVTVAYSDPSRDEPRESVYGGSVVGPVALAAFASAGGRMRRTEELTLRLVVRVYEPGHKTTEATDARAVEIADVITGYIATNWTLGDLAELKKATVDAVDLDGWLDDAGAGSVLTISIGLMSYLT